MQNTINEKSLETIIADTLVSKNGYELGKSYDFDREYSINSEQFFRFLRSTQSDEFAKINVSNEIDKKKFLTRLRDEITKRGIIDVLRKGINFYPAKFDLFYQTPSHNNVATQQLFEQNIFSITRQLRYSADQGRLALDLAIFINGLPVLTFELKNNFTKQNVDDAVRQYQTTRDPKELLFQFKRCMAHFAVDDTRVKFCTCLAGKNSWFLPFDKGCNGGAGNPVNLGGIRTAYLWEEILTRQSLANIIENYAQLVGKKDPETKKTSWTQIFPRFHQLGAVRALLADVADSGIGKKYLIQHSAGSGKSNSIAWLAHQLVGLEKDGKNIVDSVVVITDRVNLDRQIRDTVKQFMQVSNTVAWAKNSEELRKAITGGKKIIISTVQKFPWILDEIVTNHKNRKFAIIIDEAHSSQSGRFSAKMNMALSGEYATDDEASVEDAINQIIETRKMLKNASYFAFTATPKNKTLEMFGVAYPEDGEIKHRPFHVYTMKQAIQEGFILDVLQNYTTWQSYYKLEKVISDDPEFDKKRAQKRLRAYVESNPVAIGRKATIMVEHFHAQSAGKIGGKARAMVVAGGIDRAIEYFQAISRHLEERKSPYKAIVAFSGEKEFMGNPKATEATINGFPSERIESEFRKDPYRFLIVADKFQTGYDEPLLHTMYVDKPLADIKAVQTLSRLNRAHPQKVDTCVLDFANETKNIEAAFARYYKTTILSAETDPNQLHDLAADLENAQVYADIDVENVVASFVQGDDRTIFEPILDNCVEAYRALDEDRQVKFKGDARAFVRLYSFLAAILPYGNAKWEKLSIFLGLLVPKLPTPKDEDFSEDIIKAIDLESYRAQEIGNNDINLPDEDAEIDPVPSGKGGGKPEPELERLTIILDEFNRLFGDIDWKDADNVRRQIKELPAMVARDEKYSNARKNSDRQEARAESDIALQTAIFNLMQDNMELFKQFNDNLSFKKWLSDMVFNETYFNRI